MRKNQKHEFLKIKIFKNLIRRYTEASFCVSFDQIFENLNFE